MSNPWIRMLSGMAGDAFALSPGEKTNRFSKAEAGRLIEAGVAEPAKASADTVPDLKAELAALRKDHEGALSARDARIAELEAALQECHGKLVALEAAAETAGPETATEAGASETR